MSCHLELPCQPTVEQPRRATPSDRNWEEVCPTHSASKSSFKQCHQVGVISFQGGIVGVAQRQFLLLQRRVDNELPREKGLCPRFLKVRSV